LLPVDLRRLGSAAEQSVKQLVEVLGHVHREPHFAATITDLDWNVENYGGPAITFSDLCPSYRTTLAVVAVFATHQLLLVR
jgi:hypothetical protein